jgi:hypothetical protein
MLTKESFYTKLQEKQESSQRYNAIVEDICTLYTSLFPQQPIFSSDELWDFLFTKREEHMKYHGKIWDTFANLDYFKLFEIMYKALDDPSPSWWKQIIAEDLNTKKDIE